MKTPEDEAFDELAKRQGAWGGGYQAKRQMAADKMQKEKMLNPLTMSDDELIKHASKQVQALRMALDMIECEKYERPHVRWAIVDALKEEALAQPAQEPVAYVTGVYGGQFTYAPLNSAMVLPVGMALYAGPQREQNFCPRCGKRTNDIHTCTPPQGDA
jgi:hypothetical protein